jgi:hypothetical protein
MTGVYLIRNDRRIIASSRPISSLYQAGGLTASAACVVSFIAYLAGRCTAVCKTVALLSARMERMG